MSKIQRSWKRRIKNRFSKIGLNFDSATNKKQYWFVIRELTSREIKRKYARSYLGIVWSVLNPLLLMCVMTLIFSTMFARNIQNFPLYYLTGSIFWSLFDTGTTHAMTGLVDNKSLLLKSKIPKQIFIIARMYTGLVNFGFSFTAYIFILIFFRIKPGWTMLLLIPDLLIFMIFCLGVSFWLSILYVFFADIKYLYTVFLRVLLYLSAIFYPVQNLPAVMQKVISYNPVYLAIDIARYSMVYGLTPHYTEWIKLSIWAVFTFTTGWFTFRKLENKVMQVI